MGKGGAFENEIASKISLWLTNGKSDECVRRTESSGGRATQRSKKKKARDTMFGDICPADDTKAVQDFFNLISMELKTGYAQKTKKKSGDCTVTNWSFNDIIDGTQAYNQFFKFWDQCITDAFKSQREPILIFRRNRRKPSIAMHSDLFEAFQKFGGYGFGDFYIEIKTPMPDGVHSYTICGLEAFFKWFTYSDALLRGPITKTILKRRAK
jgi:hypothetical protein